MPAKSKSNKVEAKVAPAPVTSTSALIPATNVDAGSGGVDLPDMDQPQTKRSHLIRSYASFFRNSIRNF